MTASRSNRSLGEKSLDEKVEVVGMERKQKNRVVYLKRMLAASKQCFEKSKSPPPNKYAIPVSLPNPIIIAEEIYEEVGKDSEVVPAQHDDETAIVSIAGRVQANGIDSSLRSHQNDIDIDISIVSVSTIGLFDTADVLASDINRIMTPIAAQTLFPALIEEEKDAENTPLPTVKVVEVEMRSISNRDEIEDRSNRVRFNERCAVQQPLRPYHPRNFRERYYFGAKTERPMSQSMHRQQLYGSVARSSERKRNTILRSKTVARPVSREESQKTPYKQVVPNPLFVEEDDDDCPFEYDDDYTFEYDDETDGDTYDEEMATVETSTDEKTNKEPMSRIFCGIGNTTYEIACGSRQLCHSMKVGGRKSVSDEFSRSSEKAGGRKSVSDEFSRSESSKPTRAAAVYMPPDTKESNDIDIVRKPDPPTCTFVRASRAAPMSTSPKRSFPPAKARADPQPSSISPPTPTSLPPSFAKATPIPQAPSSKTPTSTKTTSVNPSPALSRVVPAACGIIATATQCGAMEPQEEEAGLTLFDPFDDASLKDDDDGDDVIAKAPADSEILKTAEPVEVLEVDTQPVTEPIGLETEDPLEEKDWFEKKVDEYSGVFNAFDIVATEIIEIPDTIANEICAPYHCTCADPEQEQQAYDEAMADLMLIY